MRLRRPYPRPRLRLRTLLIVVAVIALAIGGWQTWKRREYCLGRAATFEAKLADAERGYRWTLKAAHSRRTPLVIRRYQQYMELCRRAVARYHHVARYPWLPLPREPE